MISRVFIKKRYTFPLEPYSRNGKRLFREPVREVKTFSTLDRTFEGVKERTVFTAFNSVEVVS